MPRDEYAGNGWACVDCLMLIANGETPPNMGETVTSEWLATIDTMNAGYNVTLGMIREEHACATNFTVTAVGYATQANGTWPPRPVRYTYEYRATDADDARDQFYWDSANGAKILRVTEHELETENDRGGECECERNSFSWSQCDHYGSNLGGQRDAISFFKILESDAPLDDGLTWSLDDGLSWDENLHKYVFRT